MPKEDRPTEALELLARSLARIADIAESFFNHLTIKK